MKPSILIVEDDEFKLKEIKSFLLEKFTSCSMSEVGSIQKAVCKLETSVFDLIVLDIALPSHEVAKGSGTPTSMTSGGIEVLLELAFYDRQDAVIIMTQYPEVQIDGQSIVLKNLSSHINDMVSVKLLEVILFDKLERNWVSKLNQTLERNF